MILLRTQKVKKRTSNKRWRAGLNSFKIMHDKTERGGARASSYKLWVRAYHAAIESASVFTIKETLDNSPYEHTDIDKFIKYSKIGILKWVSIIKTYPDILILERYCYDRERRFYIDKETTMIVSRKSYEMVKAKIDLEDS